jgi:rhodanese-related sulfurtransferase
MIFRSKAYEKVPAENWQGWVAENDAIILDVREPREWALGTLPGALLISMGELVARIDELPDDKPILCVCRSGDRSGQVASFLARSGRDKVANLSGGMKALGMQG